MEPKRSIVPCERPDLVTALFPARIEAEMCSEAGSWALPDQLFSLGLWLHLFGWDKTAQ